MMHELLALAVTRGSITEWTIWSRDRPQGPVFWQRTVVGFNEDEWRQHFCMSIEQTFELLASELCPVLEKQKLITEIQSIIGEDWQQSSGGLPPPPSTELWRRYLESGFQCCACS